MELFHHRQLHPVAALTLYRAGAQENVEIFGGDGLIEGLFALLCAQMGQQVGNHELGLAALAQGHFTNGAVLQRHHAVDGQGNGHPLVLANAAVVVGLEVSQLAVLIEGAGLHVQPGGVDVGGGDLAALPQGFPAHHSQHHALTPVDGVHLVPGGQGHAPGKRLEARRLSQSHRLGYAESFGLAPLQKGHVAPAVVRHSGLVGSGQPVIAVLVVVKQFFFSLFQRVTHGVFPPVAFESFAWQLGRIPLPKTMYSSKYRCSFPGNSHPVSGPPPASGRSPRRCRPGP